MKPPRYTSTLKLHEDTITALLKDRYKLLTKTFLDSDKQVDNPLIQLLGTYQVVQDPRKRMPLHALTWTSTFQILLGPYFPWAVSGSLRKLSRDGRPSSTLSGAHQVWRAGACRRKLTPARGILLNSPGSKRTNRRHLWRHARERSSLTKRRWADSLARRRSGKDGNASDAAWSNWCR